MFKNKTVFVLGAGASAEVGMPVGTLLAENISTSLNFQYTDGGEFLGNGDLKDIISFHLKNIGNLVVELALETSKGIRFSNSIDEYIDRRKDTPAIPMLGKLAIIYEILRAEQRSKLFLTDGQATNGLNSNLIAGTWYLELARMLFASTDETAVEHLLRNVSFVDFNYDRCLEQFFSYAIRDGYSAPQNAAEYIVETMKHFRPYGSIGNFQTFPFGYVDALDTKPNVNQFISAIKTYTERADSEAIKEIRNEMASAHTLVFLGFGFHKQNMQLISPKKKTNISTVLATAKGMSESDMKIIQTRLSGLCDSNINNNQVVVRNLTCAELFQEYRLTLQAA